MEIEDSRGAGRAFDHAARLLENREDVAPLHVLEGR